MCMYVFAYYLLQVLPHLHTSLEASAYYLLQVLPHLHTSLEASAY
jgi:hypothetical protein